LVFIFQGHSAGMISLRNLIRNKLRTFLTLSGVSIGIAMYVAVTSYADNLKSELKTLFTNQYELIVQSREATSPFSSIISQKEYRQLSSLEGVESTPAIIVESIRISKSPYFILTGTSSIEPVLSSISLVDGRLPDLRNREVIIGKKASLKLDWKLNESIELGTGKPFTVVGIYATGSRMFDTGMIMGIRDAEQVLKRKDEINVVLIRLKKGYATRRLMNNIEHRFPNLSIVKSQDLLGQIQFVQVIDAVSRGLSLIALIIAGVFVSNTMLMAITERTREVGILMAVGWSRLMISRIIVAETLMLCVTGGILGNGLGFLMLWLFSNSDIIGLDWATAALNPGIFLRSILLSVILGLICAIYPAVVASRLSPVQALRFE
jgi:putative ABC transport system permease protein